MSDPFLPKSSDEDFSEDFKIPAQHIDPGVTTWKTGQLILTLVMIFGLGLVASGIGTGIAIGIAHTAVHKLDVRNAMRNQQIEGLITQIRKNQSQITAQSVKIVTLQQQQAKAFSDAKNVVCNASIAQAQARLRQGVKPDPASIDFLRKFGCAIPADLG